MLLSFACSMPGKTHVERDMPCQDFSLSKRLRKGDKEFIICAVADGVGSCAYSQYGSEAAVTTAVDYLSGKLANEDAATETQTMEQLIQEAFSAARDASTIDLMIKMEKPMTSFSTTLTLAIYADGALWYGHCGDGGIIVLYTDGTYEMITTRHKGEEISSVYPLSENSEWEFGAVQKEVASLAMITDGILDHYVPMFPVAQKLFYPAFRPVLQPRFDDEREIPEEELERYAEGMSGAMGTYIQKKVFPKLQEEGVTDDLSYAAIIDCERACSVPEIEFNEEQWNSEMTAHYERLRELLRQPFHPESGTNETQEDMPEQTVAPNEEPPIDAPPVDEAAIEELPVEEASVNEAAIEELTFQNESSEKRKQAQNVPAPKKKPPINRDQRTNSVPSEKVAAGRQRKREPSKERARRNEISDGAQAALRVISRVSYKAGDALRALGDKLSTHTDGKD